MHFARFVVSCAAVAAAAAPASAQLPITPRALGMGGAYTAVARGQEAIFYNPANLALPGNPHTSLAAPQITLGATINGLTFDDVDALRSFDDLDDDQRADILSRIPEEGTAAEVDVRIPIFSMSYRRAMFGVSYNLTGRHGVARDVADLVLTGVDLNRLDPRNSNVYDFGDILDRTQGYRAAYTDFAAGYAHRVGPVSLGVTAHYLRGGALVRSGAVDVDTVFSRTAPDVRVTYMGVKREGGSGFGLDVGAAIQPVPSLTLSAAVTNAVNTLEWKGEQELRYIVLDRGDYVNGDPELLRDEYGNSGRTLSQAEPLRVAQAQGLLADLDVGAELAPTLRAGAAWKPRAGTTVAASYTGELSDSRLAGPWNRSLSVGWQQKIPVVTLRAGIASDLDGGGLLGGGLSLGPVHVGAARFTGSAEGNTGQRGWLFTFGFGGQTRSTMN
ncbi:MAG: conjugal transfer protein TraF [Gemmatimonadetes bacterium]|nr:conjugal transfer protein TraF [Gemmatimonadota bacterium]